VTAIRVGDSFACARTSGGGLKCWGYNGYGELGNSAAGTGGPTPFDVSTLTSGVTAFSTGVSFACAVTSGGAAQCWGQDLFGQLGDGSSGLVKPAAPVSNPMPRNVVGFGSGIASISAGTDFACALTTSGGVKCWGVNNSGQLGNGTTTSTIAPVDVSGLGSGVAAIGTGDGYACALTTGGGVKCWGYNGFGNLGNGSGAQSLIPVDVSGLGSGVTALSVGNFHSCALTTGGAAKCWGDNGDGELGNSAADAQATSSVPLDVTVTSGIAAIAPGNHHTCVLTSAGGVQCWGSNAFGTLGNNSTTDSPTAVNVVGLSSGVVAIGAGSSNSCALMKSGAVECWGINDAGETGQPIGGVASNNVPVVVSGL
jgi:alpha-tubulin suppressor-like RCC1 family protein